jgi:2'-5' RNA ligase
MRPNWFLAFPIDGHFVQELGEVPKAHRRFHLRDVHLTLAFLGAVSETAALNAWSVLGEQLAQAPLPPFEISLGAVVPMGRPKAYTALSALLERGNPIAADAIARLRDALTDAAGARRDTRPPKPHVTLLRPARRASDADRSTALEWCAALDLRQVTAVIDQVALYTWNIPRVDGYFRIVKQRPLG